MSSPHGSSVRGATTPWLILVVAVTIILTAGIHLLLRAGVFTPLVRATDGLIHRSLLGNAILLLVVVGGLIFWLGGLRPRQVGLVPGKLPVAVAVTFGMWLLMQAIQLVSALLSDGTFQVSPAWSGGGATVLVGMLLAQLFGTALVEEIIFRGYLLTQVREKLHRRWLGSARRALIPALLISQFSFAVFHLPGHIASGLGPVDIVIDLVRLTLLGTLFALLYLRTGNLFIGIGIHSLSNNPTALFVPDPNQDSLLALAFGALIIIFWPRRRERESETTARSSAAGSRIQ
ncbi:type II CAAX endopeptidase family protein [Corynebacterium sp.]|uniref:CPBP family intramembrane glutamic endopeptidase n=1 Tax=Corynebacterium sp. TaxID=1720 RepID=UPI00199A00E5|nr:type II CAAX endopeptidase family protein [Corynebacterium sp.]HHU66459.1 CPBP family intramembrane metalloprotease [Corynebacterium sp.]